MVRQGDVEVFGGKTIRRLLLESSSPAAQSLLLQAFVASFLALIVTGWIDPMPVPHLNAMQPISEARRAFARAMLPTFGATFIAAIAVSLGFRRASSGAVILAATIYVIMRPGEFTWEVTDPMDLTLSSTLTWVAYALALRSLAALVGFGLGTWISAMLLHVVSPKRRPSR